jgi:hypothetical protein
MKTKLYTSIIVTLVIVGVTLAIPVPSVQAWGCRCKTRFTGYASPDIVPDGTPSPAIPGSPIWDWGELVHAKDGYELWKGVKIGYNHIWDSSSWVEATFGEGRIVNTVWNLNTPDGTSYMWGTHVLEFDSGIVLRGTVSGKRYPDPSAPDGSTTISRWVSVGDGFKVIWKFDSRLDRQDSGVIIEL